MTKLEPAQGDQWPEERQGHTACCLNYAEVHPKVLVFGGKKKCYKKNYKELCDIELEDMWLLDVDSGKWTEVRVLVCSKFCYDFRL